MPSKNNKTVFPLVSQAGIKRDGTALDGNFYSDGLWCRFRNGRPKKIGGYRELINLSTVNVPANSPAGPVRGIYPVMYSPQLLINCFHGSGVSVVNADQSGTGGSVTDRTPAGWVAADTKSMSAGALYSAPDTTTVLVMHAAPDLLDITNDTAALVYYGIANAVTALVTTTKSVSGGCCVLGPFIFAFGSNGEISNCDTNQPTVWSGGNANSANPASTKVVAGLPLRGGANAPAGLFWSLAELIRVSFVGGTTIWRYDILSDQSSILGKNTVVEYDGVYYWPGVDRFLMYNGVMKEIPNPLNQDFFFDNINMPYRNKCWGMRIARWGEIWWFFPKYPATECNWAVVYNVRENTWYDTPITRAAGFPARELPLVLMTDSAVNTDSSGGVNGYRVFQQEFGVDKVVNGNQTAIQSNFTTSDVGLVTGGPENSSGESPNVQTRITRVEPDFVQTRDMTCSVITQPYPQSATADIRTTGPKTFDPRSESDDPVVVDLREQGRIMSLKFESNILGGNYHAGKILMHLEPGDERA